MKRTGLRPPLAPSVVSRAGPGKYHVTNGSASGDSSETKNKRYELLAAIRKSVRHFERRRKLFLMTHIVILFTILILAMFAAAAPYIALEDGTWRWVLQVLGPAIIACLVAVDVGTGLVVKVLVAHDKHLFFDRLEQRSLGLDLVSPEMVQEIQSGRVDMKLEGRPLHEALKRVRRKQRRGRFREQLHLRIQLGFLRFARHLLRLAAHLVSGLHQPAKSKRA